MAVRSIDYQKSVLAGQEEASLLLKKSPDSNSSGIKTTPKIAPSTRGAGKTSAGPSPHPSSNIEIIVAEDHNANRVYAVSLLNKLGYNPRIAANGLEVLEMGTPEALRCDPDGLSNAGGGWNRSNKNYPPLGRARCVAKRPPNPYHGGDSKFQ